MHSKNVRAKIIPTAGIKVLKVNFIPDVGKEWFIDGNRTLNDYWMLLS